MSICLTVYEVLHDNVVRAFGKVLIGNGLNFESEIKVWEVFEGNWRHSDLIFFGRYFDHPSIFANFEEFFEAVDFRDFTADTDGETHWFGVFELNFEYSWDFVIFFNRRYFDRTLTWALYLALILNLTSSKYSYLPLLLTEGQVHWIHHYCTWQWLWEGKIVLVGFLK